MLKILTLNYLKLINCCRRSNNCCGNICHRAINNVPIAGCSKCPLYWPLGARIYVPLERLKKISFPASTKEKLVALKE